MATKTEGNRYKNRYEWQEKNFEEKKMEVVFAEKW